MSNHDQLRGLFSESSLSELLVLFEGAYPHPMPARALGGWMGILCFVVLSLVALLSETSMNTLDSAAALLAGFAVTVSAALTGFVIAGLSIFAASLKPDVSKSLISTSYPGTDIPSLKFIFAMFAYFLFALFLVLVSGGAYYAVFDPDALVRSILTQIAQKRDLSVFLKFTQIAYISALFGLLLFLLSLLKSFIWNLHQVLMVTVVVGQMSEKEDEAG